MNQTPQQPPRVTIRLVPDPNPWENKSALPHLPLPIVWVLSLLVIAFASYHPLFAPSQVHTAILLTACALCLALVARSITASVFALIFFLFGFLFGGLAGATYVVCLLMTVSIGAYLCCVCRSKYLTIIPTASYLTCLVWTQDPLLSLLSLMAFPAALVLSRATMKNDGRVSAITATSFSLGLCLVAGLTLVWCRENAVVSFSSIISALDGVRDEWIATLQQPQYTELLQQSLQEQNLTLDMEVSLLIRAVIELLFPALAVIFVNLLCFAAQLICIRSFGSTGMKQLITHSSQLFIMSIPAALIYLICAIACLFLSNQPLVFAVMQNLQLILLPGLCLIGIYKLIADMRKKISPFRVLFLAFIGTCAPFLLVLGLAISGAITTLLRPFITRALLAGQISSLPKDDDSSDDSSNSDPS